MNLKELRISKGFSQQNAAILLNMPLRTYKRYELDKTYENSYKYKAIFNTLKTIEKSHKKISENIFQKVCIIGGGYVGLNIAKVLSKKTNVEIVDIDKEKVDLINGLKLKNIKAVKSLKDAGKFEVAIICLPTNFDENNNCFDTKSIKKNIEEINRLFPSSLIVIKSTVGVGFTDSIKNVTNEILYAPEFLREKTAYTDALKPDRLIIGCKKVSQKAYKFASTIESVIVVPRKTIFMSFKEAEAVKLYSNAYLSMRIAFFNDLDTFAMSENIDSKKVIKAIGLDKRIGDYYNNPSFSYSGYCLPKDTKALSCVANSALISSIDQTNENHKQFVVKTIVKEARKRKSSPTIGIFNLETEKSGKKYRQSSSLELLELLKKYSIKVVVFDKNYKDSVYNFDEFCKVSDLIVCNRYDEVLNNVKDKVFTRDLLSK